MNGVFATGVTAIEKDGFFYRAETSVQRFSAVPIGLRLFSDGPNKFCKAGYLY
ncbi:hypothetical protein [Neisseria animaloris]|uniref:hypothetical protein n=1 Tax=Neisseria animaloris TaxID=326522 RepID=UPI0015594AD3|nr:hypothetical protein [Neisseria animaloris]